MKKILLSIVFSLVFFAGFGQADAFITKWKIKSDDLKVTIPVDSDHYTYNYDIDWGDSTANSGVTGGISHNYSQEGDYSITITGSFPHIEFNNKTQLIDVEQWGTSQWGSMFNSFSSCQNITTFSATDIPDLSIVTDMRNMFTYATSFNGDIMNWDVSNVTSMHAMFYNATSFNQDIGNWDVSKVTDMSTMFKGYNSTPSFNQDIGNWDVGNVTNMEGMFSGASRFNQDIGSWDVGNVTNMKGMFSGVSRFNQDIGNWDVGNVTSMKGMFSGASRFNQDIGNWAVGNVTNMHTMFSSVSQFNQDLGSWDVRNVTDMSWMFYTATSFNGDIGSWNVSKATDMSYMFTGATSFNGDIVNWDVSNVTDMSSMFASAPLFNQDIGNWDVTYVKNMNNMFNRATQFNQDIGNWDVTYVSYMDNMFSYVKLSTENYDALLEGWSKLDLEYDVNFGAGNSKYCNSEEARQKMINDFGWKITDGGRDSECTLGVDDEILAEGLSVYPNPSANSLTINSKLPLEKVEIFSVSGQKEIEINAGFNSISTDILSEGIYFIKIYSEKGTTVRKLIKE